MARTHVGRHRAPGFTPLGELTDIATRSAQPAMKVSAVAVASGGLVAAFALPASAAPAQGSTGAAASSALAAPAAAQLPSAKVAVAAPAVETALAPTFGVAGFTATAAAAPAPAPIAITKVAPPAPPAAPAAAPAASTAKTPAKATTPAKASTSTTTTRAARTTTRTAPAAPAAPAAPPAPTVAPPAPTGGILGIAAGLSGIPYVYGGTTTRGFDCSGFTSYVYRLAGKSIPRTAEAQRAASTKVSNPVPGDLIFFGYPAYHVGIYAGAGKLYDAQHPGTVTGLHVIWTTSNLSYGRF